MITAYWKSTNPAYAHALVDVLTELDDEAIIKTYDQVTHRVPKHELEPFVEKEKTQWQH